MTQATEANGATHRGRGTAHALVLLHLGALALGTAGQHVYMWGTHGDEARVRVLCVACGLFCFAGLLLASMRRDILAVTSSTLYAAVSLTALALLSILGTVVLQGQPDKVYHDGYGPMAGLVLSLFLDDVFHSFGFSMVVGLGAGSLVATLFTIRRWTLRRIGIAGSHVGLVVILAGAAVGSVWGVKGRIELRVGQTADRFVKVGPGHEMEEALLGFTLRLDRFDLLYYEPDFRLRVYEILEDQEKLVVSVDPRSPAASDRLSRHGATLVGYWPDHSMRLEVEPAGQGQAGAAAALGIGAAGAPGDTTWLFDPGHGQVEYIRLTGGETLGFVWSKARADEVVARVASGKKGGPTHAIELEGARLEVEVGRTYALPGTDLTIRVLAAYKDFVIDPETKQPEERSSEPDNPALSVEISDSTGAILEKRWLFANFPGFGHKDSPSGPKMEYSYEGGTDAFSGGWLVVGELAEAWAIAPGTENRVVAAREGSTIEVGPHRLVVDSLLASAGVRYVHTSLSDKAVRPVAEISVVGEDQTRFLGVNQAASLPDGLVLALAPKGDDVRDYVSTLTVLEAGRERLVRKVEVNHPLTYGGFSVYQSEYDPRDTDFSGFEVVRDPGMWLVYLGFVLLIAGVTHVILVVPIADRLRRGRRASTMKGQADAGA